MDRFKKKTDENGERTSLKIKMDDVLSKFLPYTGHEYTAVEL